MRSMARALLLLLLLAGSAAQADEGMWTPDNFPKALVKQKLGVDVTDAWLDKVRLATTRISGCTGSFISPDGLMLTNDHCSWGCLAQLSTPDSDLLANGFLARTRAEEKRCPTQTASILVGLEDVTAKIAEVTRGLDDQAANAANKKELTRLEEACEAASKKDRKIGELSCEAVMLYNGGQYFIYKYKRYEDVRIVFAPEFAIGAFGGDPDNFQFPRWCLDMSILRVYSNGKPLGSPNYLRVNWNGPEEGQPVFVSGHPGSTKRLLSVEELKTLRDTDFPFLLMRHSELRGRYIQHAKTSAEAQRIVKDKLELLENSIKVYRKEFDSLLSDELMATKVAEENALRQAATADPALRTLVGSAWEDMAKTQAIHRDLCLASAGR